MPRKYPKADKEVNVLHGSAIFMKKKRFKKINGFDNNIFLYHDDDDASLRLRKYVGPLMYINNSKIVHLEGRSSSRNNEIAAIKGYHMGRSRVYIQVKAIKGQKSKTLILCPLISCFHLKCYFLQEKELNMFILQKVFLKKFF